MNINLSRIRPIGILCVVISLYALRWVVIANGNDYGWDYETGYRVFRGGVYGKDFYTLVGPLSYELIGLVFKWFGPLWIWTYLIAYGCWILTLWGVYELLKSLTSNSLVLAISVLIVTPLSIPHLVALHSYNFLGYLLAVWNGVLLFKFLKTQQYRLLIAAGFLGALSLFAKQNIGLGSLLLTVTLLFFASLINPARSLTKVILSSSAYCISAIATSAVLFFRFSREIGFNELKKLMFFDASKAKGNALNIIKTGIPRISFGVSNEHNLVWLLQHLAEGFFLMLAIGINIFLFRRSIFKSQIEKLDKTKAPTNRDLLFLVLLLVMLTLIPILFPSNSFLIRENFYWFDIGLKISRSILAFLSWVVLGGGFFYFWVLFHRYKSFDLEQYKKLALFIYSSGICFFVCTSSFGYFFISLSLFLGFFFCSTMTLGLWSRKSIYIVCLFLWSGVYFYYPTHALAPLIQLEGPLLSGLWFGEKDRESVEVYTKELRPYVLGKRTLWLLQGGPHSLSGSIPVRNISNLCYDQFNSRIEESLVRNWMLHPPEIIVRHWYSHPENLHWLKSAVFENWIKNNYVQVAEIRGRKVLKYRF